MCYQMHSSVTFLSPDKHSSCCLSSLLCWDYVRKLYLEGDFTSAKWVCISCAAFFLTGKILLLCPFPLKRCFPVEIPVEIISQSHLRCRNKAGGALTPRCSYRSLTLWQISWSFLCWLAVSSGAHHLSAANRNKAALWFYMWEVVEIYSEVRNKLAYSNEQQLCLFHCILHSSAHQEYIVGSRPAWLGGSYK